MSEEALHKLEQELEEIRRNKEMTPNEREKLLRSTRKKIRKLKESLGLREIVPSGGKPKKDPTDLVTPKPKKGRRGDGYTFYSSREVTPEEAEAFHNRLIEELVALDLPRLDKEGLYRVPGYGYHLTMAIRGNVTGLKDLLEKFTTRWGREPEWWTTFKVGKDNILVLGPVPVKDALSFPLAE